MYDVIYSNIQLKYMLFLQLQGYYARYQMCGACRTEQTISSRTSCNSEAYASELHVDPEEMLLIARVCIRNK